MNNSLFRHASVIAFGMVGCGLLAGCSNPGEDVRVALCKDLAAEWLDPSLSLTWKETSLEMHRADHLAVNLRFEAQPRDGDGKPMQATCFYRHDAVEDTALILADPLAAYATSPYGMTLNGKAIGNPLLAEGIGRAMLKQGRALLERTQQGIDAATQKILHREQDVPSR